MLRKAIFRMVRRFLDRDDLTYDEKSYLSTKILDKLAALPLRDIIEFSDTGSLLINGRPQSLEQMKILHESARALRSNYMRRLIREQVAYNAIKLGLHKAVKIEDTNFSKAAIWWGQNEEKLIDLLAGEEIEEE